MASDYHATPEQRRFSIRLPRPLWIGLATAALVLVALGLRFGVPIYRQEIAVREVQGLRGPIGRMPRTPEWLRTKLGHEWATMFDEVTVITLSERPATDSTVRKLSGLTGLTELRLENT